MIKNNLLKVCAIAFILLNLQISTAQVGIGTSTPDGSSAIDVTSTTAGALFPRMTTTQRNAISTPATGLLVYNTTTNTFDYNMGTPGTPNWISLGSGETRSVKYTSTDTTTDLNNAAITPIPLFGSLDWNDDTSLFVLQNTSTISVAEAGRYKITVNLFTDGTNQRDQLQMGIYINGVIQSAPFSTNELIFGVLHSSVNFTDILELNANDQISIQSEDFVGGGTVNMRLYNGAASNILIERIN